MSARHPLQYVAKDLTLGVAGNTEADSIGEEYDGYRLVASATLVRVAHYRRLFAQLKEIATPPELKNVKSELVELLKRELRPLCRGNRGARSKDENVSAEFLLGYMDGVADAVALRAVEGEEQEGSR